MRLTFTGIQAKTFYIFFAVFLVITLPVNLLIYSQVSAVLEESDSNELRNEADRLLSQTRLDPLAIPLPAAGYSLKIQTWDQAFFQEIFSSPDFPQLDEFQFLENVARLDTMKVVTLRTLTGQSTSALLFSLARSTGKLTEHLNDLRFYLFVANVASILIAGTVVFFAMGITLRPIRKIIDIAKRINAAKSIQRVPVPKSRDENQQLAQTLNEMLERIEQSIQNQVNFFASATHELKTPLAVMQASLSISLEKESSAEVKKVLETNLNEVRRLDRVIQDFLVISQLKSETLVLRKKQVRCDDIFYASLKKLQFLAREKNVSVQVTVEDKAFLIEADPDKIETVFTNVVENAIIYSPTGSIVYVSLAEGGSRIVFQVRNFALVAVPDAAGLGQEFTRSNALGTGLGMGLWICKKILELHGAQLSLNQAGDFFEVKISF